MPPPVDEQDVEVASPGRRVVQELAPAVGARRARCAEIACPRRFGVDASFVRKRHHRSFAPKAVDRSTRSALRSLFKPSLSYASTCSSPRSSRANVAVSCVRVMSNPWLRASRTEKRKSRTRPQKKHAGRASASDLPVPRR